MEAKEGDTTAKEKRSSFHELGVCKELCESLERLKWKIPTPIQQQSIPAAIQGHDIIGLAETGSGKTGAFAVPILQAILANPRRLAALVLAPVREIALQIGDQFKVLGAHLGVETAVIVGGMPKEKQVTALYKKPHVIIATPGRLVDHLENTKGFDDIIKAIRFLVFDEADRLLDMEFQEHIDKILQFKPHDTITYLYSATMTKKVGKLQRAALLNPVKVDACVKYQTVETLKQYMMFAGYDEDKDCYLVHILNENQRLSALVFCGTIDSTERIAMLLNNIGFQTGAIHGQMGQAKRLDAIRKFKEKTISILVATDVACRGLDFPHIDLVINFDIPSPTNYIHRVGRTARAGRNGVAITIVSASDAQSYLLIEDVALKKKLPKYEVLHEKAMFFKSRVEEALARGNPDNEFFESENSTKRPLSDSEEESGNKKMPMKIRKMRRKFLRKRRKQRRK